MTRTKILLFAGMAVLSMSALAHANPEADTNGDGVITHAEFMAAAKAKFERADLNADGFISQSERQSTRMAKETARRDELFNRLDLNNDGFISRTEFDNEADARQDKRKSQNQNRKDARNNRLEQLRNMADTDGDGTISESEREALRLKMSENGQLQGEAMRELRDQRQRPEPEGRDPLARIDANGDGLISFEEHSEGAEKMFKYLDANNDGKLERGEGQRQRKRGGKRRNR